MTHTLDERLVSVVGTPGEEVTHWGISKIEKGKQQRLDFPNSDGVRLKEWPLELLTLDTIRSQWGAGEFRCHWLILDSDNVNPEHRRRSGGQGPIFGLEPEQVAAVAPAPSPFPLPVAPGSDMSAALSFATALMQMGDQRANQTLEAVTRMAGVRGATGATDEGTAQLRAELARMQARLEADEKRRELEDRHREEVRRLERERDEAVRRAEDSGRDEAPFTPDMPIVDQLATAGLNILAAKPDLAAAIFGPVLEGIMGKLTGKSSAPPAPPPPAPPRPRVVVVDAAPPAPPPAPSTPTATSSQRPIDETAAVSEKVPTNGAAPKPAPRAPAKKASQPAAG